MFSGFFGTFEHNIDEKNRITFPARFRENLSEGAFIMGGLDNNLLVMTTSQFNMLCESLKNLNFTDPDARELQRFIFSTSTEIEFDKNGRFIIPQNLRSLAQIENSAIVYGAYDRIEIWSPELHCKRNEVLQRPNAIAELAKKFELKI